MQDAENIGIARVYGFNLKDAAYEGDATEWDLHLYDIQVRTNLILNRTDITDAEIPVTSLIVGKSSGAIGFAATTGTNNGLVELIQTNGRFAEGEAIQVNGVDFPAGIGTVTTFGINDVRGVKQKGAANFPGDGATGGTNINFKARPVLRKAPLPNNTVDIIVGAAGIATAVNASAGGFTGLKHCLLYTSPSPRD